MQKHAAASFQTGGGEKKTSEVDSTGPPTPGHAHISETPGVGEASGRTSTSLATPGDRGETTSVQKETPP